MRGLFEKIPSMYFQKTLPALSDVRISYLILFDSIWIFAGHSELATKPMRILRLCSNPAPQKPPLLSAIIPPDENH
jgi:hypothetical protein